MATVLRGKAILIVGYPGYDAPHDIAQVIPEPRCINKIKAGLEKGRYKEASDVYTDLSLVFWNALFYNEPKSQIALDAETVKVRQALLIENSSSSKSRQRWRMSGGKGAF